MKNDERSKKRYVVQKKGIEGRSCDQGSLSSRNFQFYPKTLRLSEVDHYYDTVNTLLKKRILDQNPLNPDERSELNHIIDILEGLDCENDKKICKSDTCRFAGIPDDWVKYEGFEYLCDLVYNHIDYGPNLVPPGGCDAMCKVVDGHACANH